MSRRSGATQRPTAVQALEHPFFSGGGTGAGWLPDDAAASRSTSPPTGGLPTGGYATGEQILITGTERGVLTFARCCYPIPGDEIVGYLGRGEGLLVHTADCRTGRRLFERDSERWMQVECVTIHRFRSTCRDKASAVANAPLVEAAIYTKNPDDGRSFVR